MTQTHINIAMLAHVDAGKTTLSRYYIKAAASAKPDGWIIKMHF